MTRFLSRSATGVALAFLMSPPARGADEPPAVPPTGQRV